MATFVIVHGAWGGGWEWSSVAESLRAAGQRVFTPTLTGMGQRAHLAKAEPIDLETHIADVAAVLEFEQLHDVVLCGASYGAMAATGAADRVPSRVRLVVYIDGLVPVNGLAGVDMFPAAFASIIHDGVARHGTAWRVPMPQSLVDALIPEGSVPEAVRRNYLERIRDHPVASFIEPVRLTGASDLIPKAFIRCTTTRFPDDLGGDPIATAAQRAREDGWAYRELPVPHDPQLFDPDGIAALLVDLATKHPGAHRQSWGRAREGRHTLDHPSVG